MLRFASSSNNNSISKHLASTAVMVSALMAARLVNLFPSQVLLQRKATLHRIISNINSNPHHSKHLRHPTILTFTVDTHLRFFAKWWLRVYPPLLREYQFLQRALARRRLRERRLLNRKGSRHRERLRRRRLLHLIEIVLFLYARRRKKHRSSAGEMMNDWVTIIANEVLSRTTMRRRFSIFREAVSTPKGHRDRDHPQ